MERRSLLMSGQRARQTQLFNTVIGLNTTQREPLSGVSELQRQGPVIGLLHVSVCFVSPKCLMFSAERTLSQGSGGVRSQHLTIGPTLICRREHCFISLNVNC